jgi:hypothetical protein
MRLTKPARFIAKANELPIMPQPMMPSCSNCGCFALLNSDTVEILSWYLDEMAEFAFVFTVNH